jgi:hypothetical protein
MIRTSTQTKKSKTFSADNFSLKLSESALQKLKKKQEMVCETILKKMKFDGSSIEANTLFDDGESGFIVEDFAILVTAVRVYLSCFEDQDDTIEEVDNRIMKQEDASKIDKLVSIGLIKIKEGIVYFN